MSDRDTDCGAAQVRIDELSVSLACANATIGRLVEERNLARNALIAIRVEDFGRCLWCDSPISMVPNYMLLEINHKPYCIRQMALGLPLKKETT